MRSCHRPVTTASGTVAHVKSNEWIDKHADEQDFQQGVGQGVQESRVRSESYHYLVGTYFECHGDISIVTYGSGSTFDRSLEHVEVRPVDNLFHARASIGLNLVLAPCLNRRPYLLVRKFLEPGTGMTRIVCPLAQSARGFICSRSIMFRNLLHHEDLTIAAVRGRYVPAIMRWTVRPERSSLALVIDQGKRSLLHHVVLIDGLVVIYGPLSCLGQDPIPNTLVEGKCPGFIWVYLLVY
jgi:hypothetical protein